MKANPRWVTLRGKKFHAAISRSGVSVLADESTTQDRVSIPRKDLDDSLRRVMEMTQSGRPHQVEDFRPADDGFSTWHSYVAAFYHGWVDFSSKVEA